MLTLPSTTLFATPFAQPFQLCFYNTTPNEFTLAVRMGTVRSEGLMRWVWEANRGNPVGEKATLTFGKDGNLVLAHADGRIAWQTNTANKGVVGFELLSNGNMVLCDSKRRFVWQSFNSPTDTLLVGQSLKLGGVSKLVSRASEKVNKNDRYSLVLAPNTVSMYNTSSKSQKPRRYFSFSKLIGEHQGYLGHMTFNGDLSLGFNGKKVPLSPQSFNTALSYLRLGIDGNLRIYTDYTYVYDNDPDPGRAWVVTYTLL
ncbi:hypothetical protein K2173_023385 [Erythroxylum novogranatense]|uniref:Bulb-type lectin domain-containing protein n=1 Tax=Erythroxylum novogranatense TaxID=1862640 RepID=A0AAV8TYZ6_9ROSI|nr:hypothetical protein K2173_023385 [Erythroxylum novogranatense]